MRDTIAAMLERDPFQAFDLILTGGDRVNVHDPRLAVLMQNQLFVAQSRSDSFTLLPLNQIVDVEAGQAAA
jgi:hypothetical protein